MVRKARQGKCLRDRGPIASTCHLPERAPKFNGSRCTDLTESRRMHLDAAGDSNFPSQCDLGCYRCCCAHVLHGRNQGAGRVCSLLPFHCPRLLSQITSGLSMAFQKPSSQASRAALRFKPIDEGRLGMPYNWFIRADEVRISRCYRTTAFGVLRGLFASFLG